ncbi:MAG: C4-dicarboxylate ABC transporter substrate-binding protein [Chloroflexi bacterium]|nr:MAG: C4-dicarboxylate ABC transporter substrate-binding protein [Chloroflexota bacterium]
MRALLRLTRAIDRFTESLGTLSTLLVLVTLGVGFYNVVARYVGRFIGVQLSSNLFIELQWYLYSLVFFLGFAYILKHDANVRVDFLYANWPPRRRAWVDLLGTVFLLIPFCLLGIYVTIDPVLASWGRLPNGNWGAWELSPDPDGLPRAPLKSMIIVAFLTLLIQALAQCVKYIATLRGGAQTDGELEAKAEGQGAIG